MNDDDVFCNFTSFIVGKTDVITLNNAIAFTDEIIQTLTQNITDTLSDAVTRSDEVLTKLTLKYKDYTDGLIDSVDARLKDFGGQANACVCKALNSIDLTIKELAGKVPQDSPVTFIDTPKTVERVIERIIPATPEKNPDFPTFKGAGPSQWAVYYAKDIERFVACPFKWRDDWDKISELFPTIEDCYKWFDSAISSVPADSYVGKLLDRTDRKLYRCDEKIPVESKKQEERKEREQEDRELTEKVKGQIKELFSQPTNWSASDICKSVAKVAAANVERTPNPVGVVIGVRSARGGSLTADWAKAIVEPLPFVPNGFADVISSFARAFTDSIDAGIGIIRGSVGCDPAGAIDDIVYQAILGMVRKWTGLGVDKLDEVIARNIDASCPARIPSESDADEMWFANEIGIDEWSCWVRGNNVIPTHREKLLETRRTRQSAAELMELWKRDQISEKELDRRMRALGWTRDDEVQYEKELAFLTPSPSDLIPWMLRDVFDAKVIQEFGLSDEFSAKYTGEAKKLFRAAGVKDDVALKMWQSHWVNPSNTALFEMYHRLRGGKGSSGIKRYYDKDGNKLPAPIELSKDDIKVTEEQVARAIGVNDVAPFWRDRLLAISRPTLTRVDVRRAYEIDAINEEQVYESYRDLGYDEDNAKTLTEFSKKLKEKANVRRNGRILPSRIAAMYEAFTITETEAIELLTQSGLSQEEAKVTLEQAKIRVKARQRSQCLKAIKKRFLYGDIEEGALRRLLVETGLSQEQAITYASSLKCELTLKHKEATASQLCKWFTIGLIDEQSYARRLARIGYSKDDVSRIISTCKHMEEAKGNKKKKKGSEKDETNEGTENKNLPEMRESNGEANGK